jgi:hypothetical protein
MLPDRRAYEEEPCPVSDQTLGELYRSNSHGLAELVATVPPETRAVLAIYCYRRAHLSAVGLAIAASCEEDDLANAGGYAGTVLFAKSRAAPQGLPTAVPGRRKITLASGPLRTLSPLEDEIDD